VPRAGTYTARRTLLAEVLELYAAGLSVRDIASRCSVRMDYAARLLNEGLRSLPAADVDDLRAGTELRLDKLAATYGALLDDPDPKVRLTAAAGLRQVESDRSRLLGTWQKPPREES
jgi:hypothetical protein